MSKFDQSIDPKQVLRIILTPNQIPPNSTVTKASGYVTYTLKHDLIVYAEKDRPMVIAGFFLIGERGSINQVSIDTMLAWLVTADEFVDELRLAWEPTPQ